MAGDASGRCGSSRWPTFMPARRTSMRRSWTSWSPRSMRRDPDVVRAARRLRHSACPVRQADAAGGDRGPSEGSAGEARRLRGSWATMTGTRLAENGSGGRSKTPASAFWKTGRSRCRARTSAFGSPASPTTRRAHPDPYGTFRTHSRRRGRRRAHSRPGGIPGHSGPGGVDAGRAHPRRAGRGSVLGGAVHPRPSRRCATPTGISPKTATTSTSPAASARRRYRCASTRRRKSSSSPSARHLHRTKQPDEHRAPRSSHGMPPAEFPLQSEGTATPASMKPPLGVRHAFPHIKIDGMAPAFSHRRFEVRCREQAPSRR